MATPPNAHEHLPLSPLDLHVLLVLGGGPLYGYAIMQAVTEESGGTLNPRIGSLYRVLGRLTASGLVEDAPAASEADDDVHPGKERRYYRLTVRGEDVARADLGRLEEALELARSRRLLPGGSTR